MEFRLKSIAKDAIPAALASAEGYRLLNEPSEAESICRDVLAIEPEHQMAKRLLGLALTDQFRGGETDAFVEAEKVILSLEDSYERLFHAGLLYERRAKAELHAGHAAYMVTELLQRALACFEQAEQVRPSGNDDALLRWNRCVRLVRSRPDLEWLSRDTKDPHE